MKAFNLPLFWIVAVPSFSIWLAGVYFVIKGWTEKKEPGVKTEHAPAIEQPQPIPKPKIEEEIISEKEIEIQVPSITQEPSPTNEEFYAEFGKPNIVEFPAEYVSENHVRGLDGDPINAIEFAKSCYTQIGFRCLDTVFTGTKDNHVYKVSIFDLLCDHYASDEDFHISFFGENKEKLQGELASIKSSPEYVQENIAKLAAVYKDLPQLLIWNDKELFFILVKGKDESLTQKEIHWLRESVLDKKLVRAKIFRVTEKKAPEEKATTLPEENQAPQPEEKEKQTKKLFTKEEVAFLKANRGSMSNEKMAETLGRSVDSITHKLSRLGISREAFHWTKGRENYLKSNFPKLSYKTIAERLGTTIPSVRARCKKLRLKK